MAALVAFLIVNVMQTGEVGVISLRLLTGLPFLGLVPTIPPREHRGQPLINNGVPPRFLRSG